MNTTRPRSLKLKIDEVPSSGISLDFSSKSSELNGVLFDILGDFPIYDASVNVLPVDSTLMLRGQLKGELPLSCSKCGEIYNSRFSKHFNISFCPNEKDLSFAGDDLGEMTGSLEVEFIKGNEIDLGEVIHEQVALEIPFQPLCKENCEGLCLKCGINLNNEKCQCPVSSGVLDDSWRKTSPFTALKDLKGD